MVFEFPASLRLLCALQERAATTCERTLTHFLLEDLNCGRLSGREFVAFHAFERAAVSQRMNFGSFLIPRAFKRVFVLSFSAFVFVLNASVVRRLYFSLSDTNENTTNGRTLRTGRWSPANTLVSNLLIVFTVLHPFCCCVQLEMTCVRAVAAMRLVERALHFRPLFRLTN